jgi:hypothetical protein
MKYNTKKNKKNKKIKSTIKLLIGGDVVEPSSTTNNESTINDQSNSATNSTSTSHTPTSDKPDSNKPTANDPGSNKPGANKSNANNSEAVKEIEDRVKAAHTLTLPSMSSLANSPFVKFSIQIAKGVLLSTINTISYLLGVDLTNPEKTEEQLARIKQTLSNPEMQQKILDILEAAEPFLEPLISTFIAKLQMIGTKSASALVNVILDTAQGVPGAGIVLGAIRSATNVGEAIFATINAISQMVTKTSDTVNATSQNLERIVEEKRNNINQSVEEFSNPIAHFSEEPTSSQEQSVNKNSNAVQEEKNGESLQEGHKEDIIGGATRKNKKYKKYSYSITKRRKNILYKGKLRR